MDLQKYIDRYYNGNNSAFGRAQVSESLPCGVKRSQVAKWLAMGFVVKDHVLYDPRPKRQLAVPTN